MEVYRQMGAEGMTRDRNVFATMVDVHVRQGNMREALQVRCLRNSSICLLGMPHVKSGLPPMTACQ